MERPISAKTVNASPLTLKPMIFTRISQIVALVGVLFIANVCSADEKKSEPAPVAPPAAVTPNDKVMPSGEENTSPEVMDDEEGAGGDEMLNDEMPSEDEGMDDMQDDSEGDEGAEAGSPTTAM